MALHRLGVMLGSVSALLVAAHASSRQPVNDLCSGAIELSLDGACPGCTPIGEGVFAIAGDTRQATVDGGAPGCGEFGNAQKGIWYRLLGRGAVVRLSTDAAGTTSNFDTQISVYCGDSCAGLGCLTYNNDLAAVNRRSEVEFCARKGMTYWILVNAPGLIAGGQVAQGDVGLEFGEARDGQGQTLPCCDDRACVGPAEFVIPPDAIEEWGWVREPGPIGPEWVIKPEPCVSHQGINNDNHFNNGCGLTPPSGFPRRYGFIEVGQSITGWLWSNAGSRDQDWFLFNALPAGRSLVRFNFQAEGPARLSLHWGSLANFLTCNPMATMSTRSYPGALGATDTLTVLDPAASGSSGQTANLTFGFRLLLMPTGDGYPCGVNNRYVLTLQEVKSVQDCPAIPLPPGAQHEADLPTFDGSGGDDGFTIGEPCYMLDPDGTGGPDQINRKAGCEASAVTDGEFLRLTPGTPVAGHVNGFANATGLSRDTDYYKFEIGVRSVVRLAVDSNMPITAMITENSCAGDSAVFSIAATRGRCLAETWVEAPDLVALDAGTYIVRVLVADAFQQVGTGTILANIDCTDPISTYVLTVDAEPLSACAVGCEPGAIVENEPCVASAAEMFNSCLPDNDGCSRAPYSSIEIPAEGADVCGTLFSVYEPPTGASPETGGRFFVDQDDWSFTLTTRSIVTFSASADAPVRVQLLRVGMDGSQCAGGDAPVMAEADAGRCVAGGEMHVEVAPGTYALVAVPGSVEVGTSWSDYPCGATIAYSISMRSAAACCAGNADKIAPGGVNFADITATLANFSAGDGSGLSTGDANCDGVVNFADITAVLANFLAECH